MTIAPKLDLLKLSLVATVWFSVSQSIAIRYFNERGWSMDKNFMTLATEACKILFACAASFGMLGKSPFPDKWRYGFVVNSVLYMGTNLLTYAILERVNVGVYLVLVQHKVLLVVGLSTVIFKRTYTKGQWFACVLLMIGLMCTRMDENASMPSLFAVGLIVAQGMCSSFSGVWIEKMMKDNTEKSDALHAFLTDSIQMYVFGLPFYGVVYMVSAPEEHTLPFKYMCALLVNGACCGLFIGSIFKFYSSVVRIFVQGVTVVLTVWTSVAFMNEQSSWGLGMGTAAVVGGIVLFNTAKAPKASVIPSK